MALTPYAWTEEYVVPGGAGANDGSSFANAWDITQVAASLAAGKRMNFAGNFTLGASLAWAGIFVAANPGGFRGWKADQSAPAVSFSDMPQIDGAASYGITPGSFSMYKGIRFTNGTGIVSTSTDNIWLELFECDNHTGIGIGMDNYLVLNRCRIHDNGSHGVDFDVGGKVFNSEIYDNVGAGVFAGGSAPSVIGCLLARNNFGIDINFTQNMLVALCTIDDNTTQAIDDSSATGPNVLIANQITNHADALGNLGMLAMLYNNLYGNTSDGAATPHFDEGTTALDAQYVNVAANNYEIQNASLMGVSVPLLGDVNIGAWQKSDTGGGGGGGSYRPRMARG